ncbi:MAG: hemerythrin domain-containing protein [Thermoguttaceae bacterium]|jgi:hemerythrin-like domain-containing protein
MDASRREWLITAATAGVSGATAGWLCNLAAGAGPAEAPKAEAKSPQAKTAEEVSPGEDLMREHGVLKRLLLVYGEVVRRLDAKQDVPPAPLAEAAGIVQAFVEDYHEKLEEDFLFPRFKKAHRLVELVDVLAAQHVAGRRLTQTALRLATAPALRSADDRRVLAAALGQFIRMYQPHEAREDTVLFPAFHDLVSQQEYDALGEDFEKRENDRFGQDGFQKVVARVARIEKTLGIYDLAQFTPRGTEE